MILAQPHWHVLGGGAIGCLWAAYLQRQGCPVTLILRNRARLDAYPGALELVAQGEARPCPVPAQLADHPGPIEQLLIATKSYDTLDALAAVAPRLTVNATLVVLQNGMGAQQQVAAAHPGLAVYAGTTTEGAYRESPHRVVHAGRGQSWFGPLSARAKAAGTTALSPLLALEPESGFDPEIETRLWQKLAINAAINGLTALHGCRNGELAERADYRAAMGQLCEETERLAAALDQPLFDRPLIEQALAVARATAGNFSSMQQDVQHRRRTEMGYINGFICRQAELAGVEVPGHQRLVEAIDAIENNY